MKYIIIALIYFILTRDISILPPESSINEVYVLLSKILSGIFIVQFILLVYKNLIIKNLVQTYMYICLVFGSLLVSTIINDGDIRRWLMSFYPILGLSSFVFIYCKNKSRLIVFLRSVTGLYFILSLFNLLFIIINHLHGSKGGDTYFLGGQNHIGYPIIMGLFLTYCLCCYEEVKVFKLLFLFIAYCNLFIIFSVSNIIGLLIFTILVLKNPISFLIRRLTINKICIIGCSIFTILIIFGQLDTILNFSIVKEIIEDVFHKNLTLTNRTIIWSVVITQFFNSPIIGHGVRETFNLFYFNGLHSSGYFSAHNQFLQSLYEGGLLFFTSFIPLIRKFNGVLLNFKEDRLVQYVKGVFISFLIMYIGEAPGLNNIIMIIIFTMAISANQPVWKNDKLTSRYDFCYNSHL